MTDEKGLADRVRAAQEAEAGGGERGAQDAEAKRGRAARDAPVDGGGRPPAEGERSAGAQGEEGGPAPKPHEAIRGVDETDPETVERALASKADMARHVEQPEARGLAERMRSVRASAPAGGGSAEATPPRRDLIGWFTGREQAPTGKGAVTPLPPVPEGWKEVDFYPVEPPYSFVRIRQREGTGHQTYEVIEPPLTGRSREVLDFVQEALVRGLQADPGDLKPDERRRFLADAVEQILRDYRILLDTVAQQRVEYYVNRDFLGLGAIQVLMQDPHIEDISCDGPGVPLFVFHRQFEALTTNMRFEDDADLDGFVIRMAQKAGKAISISEPILDAALPDGSRLQATLGREVTENGSTFTIRRFRPDPFTPIDLVSFKTMDARMLAWFWLIVEHGHSLIFSGGTASGKTTALNAISQFIPHSAKLVSIEDTREVNLPHENWIKSVTRTGSSTEGSGEIGMFELLKAALRQRPDYILVGEVRGIEATVAFQAMATGHTVYSTMHADSARSVVYRLENDPINIPRLVLQALDVIAIQAQVRVKGRRVRRVREVVELVGMDPATRELLTNRVFSWDPAKDTFEEGARSYMLERVAAERNWSHDEVETEHARRTRLLAAMEAKGVRSVEDLIRVVRAYGRDPEKTLAEIDADG